MSRRTAEDLIAELAVGVAPVRPIPRLRVAAAAMLLAFACAAAAMLTSAGEVGVAIASAPFGAPGFALVLIGLALLAAAALSALASVVPGRDSVERSGRVIAVVGIAFALVGGLVAALQSPPQLAADLASSAACISKVAAVALLPLAVAAAFLSRGLVRRPVFAAGLGVIGAAALSGLVVHISCRVDGTLHMLAGHAMAPLVLGAALAVPVAWLISRRQPGP